MKYEEVVNEDEIYEWAAANYEAAERDMNRWWYILKLFERYPQIKADYEAIKAFRTPTKVIKGIGFHRMCPACESDVYSADGNYCSICGQALDWSEESE